ncbi:MAG: LLM class flavin-dependent oxidoreductase [Pseudomonadota bacterium]
MELWTQAYSAPRGIMKSARIAEDGGWDGISVVDSQNLSGDAFVALAMAATVTERLKLQTGVTNPITRTAATMAAAAASVSSVSRGRMVVGIGRGDSALAHLGRAPARLRQFERYLRHLQAYLGGAHVPFEELVDIPAEAAPPMSELQLAEAPDDSFIGWIAQTQAGERKVPVEVAATGPKVIGIAARTADRVMFAVGAEPDRLQWGIDLVRQARRDAGLDPHAIRFGAYVNCGCHPDMDVAHDLVRGGLSVQTRFGVMHGKTSGPLTDSQREVMHKLRDSYNMNLHTRTESEQANVLTPDFIDAYAIVGVPDRVTSRIAQIADLGIDKLVLSGTRAGVSAEGDAARELIEQEVLPHFAA